MKKTLLILSMLLCFVSATVYADDEEENVNPEVSSEETEVSEETKCMSSFRIYNNTSETIIINNGTDIDTVPSGSYSYTWGECGTPVVYSAEGSFVKRTGGTKTCSYKSDGTRLYPDEDGVYESISITSICGDEEKTGIEIESFTNTQAKFAAWSSSSDPEKYAYGLEIVATYDGEPLENVQFTVTNSNDIVIKDVHGNDAVVSTGSDGKAHIFLYAGYSYIVSQTGVDDRYAIQNGEIILNSANADIRESAEIKDDEVSEFIEVYFKNGLSDKEQSIISSTENRKIEIENWEKGWKANVDSLFDELDMDKYNKYEKEDLEEIRSKAYSEIEAEAESLTERAESDVRTETPLDKTYDISSVKAEIEDVVPHWEHWLVILFILISLALHFIFNKHLIIDSVCLVGLLITSVDPCGKSLVFLCIMIVLNLVITVIGLKYDNDYEEIEEELI